MLVGKKEIYWPTVEVLGILLCVFPTIDKSLPSSGLTEASPEIGILESLEKANAIFSHCEESLMLTVRRDSYCPILPTAQKNEKPFSSSVLVLLVLLDLDLQFLLQARLVISNISGHFFSSLTIM